MVRIYDRISGRGGEIMIGIYMRITYVRSRLARVAQRIVPSRVQRLVFDENGDLTTTISWIIGIAVIAGVGVAIYTNIIAPNLSSTTTATNNLVKSLP
jgi:hypothetical protein